MITSKLNSKAQTTVPQAVRKALGLHAGDEIAYRIEEGQVIMTRACQRPGHSIGEPFAMFSEWNSDADKNAYANL